MRRLALITLAVVSSGLAHGCKEGRPRPLPAVRLDVRAAPSAEAAPAPAPRPPGAWRMVSPGPTSASLRGLWASSPTDLYIVGDGVLLHGDGASFTVRAKGKDLDGATAIWGSSATDLYLASSHGIFHSTDGIAWSPRPTPGDLTYTAIGGSSATDVWAAGPEGAAHSTDGGETWKEVPGAVGRFDAVLARSAKDVWLSGSEPSARPFSPALLLHSVDGGRTWQTVRRSAEGAFGGMWSNDKAMIVLGPGDGELLRADTAAPRAAPRWQSVKLPGGERATAVSSVGSDVYVATAAGRILRSADAGVTFTSTPQTGLAPHEIGSDEVLSALLGAGDSMYAVGYGGVVLRSKGAGPWVVASGSLNTKNLRAVWGSSRDDVLVVGEDGAILRSTDGGDTWRDAPGRRSGAYAGIWGSGARDVYVVGRGHDTMGVILHTSDGETFTGEGVSTGELVAVWGSDADHVYAAGLHEILRTTDRGARWSVVWHDDGKRLTSLSGDDVRGGAIRASGWSRPNEAVLVESRDGGDTWHEVAGSLPKTLTATFRAPDGALYGVGYGPHIHRSNDGGVTWTEQPIEHSGYMNAITGRNGELIAAGYNGALYETRSGGRRWEAIDTGLDWTRALHGVWMSQEGDVFVVGDAGVILRRR